MHSEHEGLVVDWHRFIRTRQDEFVLRLSVLPLVLLAVIGLASFINPRLILPAVGFPVVWLAIVLWRFPVATPQTVSLVGIRRSIALCRALAVLTGLIGALLACAGSWLAAHVA